jgi:SAM-dependent methyltransferase
MNWEQVTECPLCKQNNVSYYGAGQAPLISVPGIMGGQPLAIVTTYVICNICGLIFQDRRMTEESALEFYASGEYRKLTNGLGKSNQEIRDAAKELETAQRISKYVPIGSHLDIGCSRGYLLKKTRSQGCTVFGVEPFAEYVQEDIPTVPGVEWLDTQYDTITCIHVFEHMIDPVRYAGDIIRLMKPGGRLVLEVPSDNSPGGPLRLPHYYHFRPPVILRIFAELELVSFEMTPHSLFVLRKPANGNV